MNIHEYQAREIFRSQGLPVPDSVLAETAEQAKQAAARFGGTVVIKAQVHAGGRGKAGGVKLASDPAEAGTAAAAILGMEIKGLVHRGGRGDEARGHIQGGDRSALRPDAARGNRARLQALRRPGPR
ncbi:MAG: acetate--CoA ligase family protein [Gemmatimonadales bacterium]